MLWEEFLWLVLLIFILFGIAYSVISIIKYGQNRYGLSFFKSISFFIIAVCLISLFLAWFVLGLYSDKYGYLFPIILLSLSVGFALYRNIRKSNLPFGFMFTLLQVLFAAPAIIIIFWNGLKNKIERLSA